MITGHVLGGTLCLPTGELYENLEFLCSGSNFHSQFTALTTLAPLAAVEDSIEGGHYRSSWQLLVPLATVLEAAFLRFKVLTPEQSAVNGKLNKVQLRG